MQKFKLLFTRMMPERVAHQYKYSSNPGTYLFIFLLDAANPLWSSPQGVTRLTTTTKKKTVFSVSCSSLQCCTSSSAPRRGMLCGVVDNKKKRIFSFILLIIYYFTMYNI